MMANRRGLREMNRRIKVVTVAAMLCAIALAGCGHRHRRGNLARGAVPAPSRRSLPATPLPVGYTEQGIASWYGVPYHGRPAADGEIYNMETLVAAHRLMPFNTWLRVTNLANAKTVNVRIIDRGPFVKGRIIDLSKAAARQIDLLGPGVGEVRIEVIAEPRQTPGNELYAVQAGAFANQDNAERARAGYAQQFGSAQLAVKQGATPLWRVLVGKEASIESAQRLAATIGAGSKNVFVVRLDTGPVPGEKN